MRRGAWLPLLVLLLPLAAVAGVITYVAAHASELPDGPVDLAWDRAACAFCRMHVGEPAFAAQLQTTTGEVLAFDDPGCLFEYEAREKPPVHAIWFHHLEEDRWIPASAVAFRRISPTPMGYGLGAVDAGEPGALSLQEARAEVLEKGRRR